MASHANRCSHVLRYDRLIADPDMEKIFSDLISLLNQSGTREDVVDAVALTATHVDADAMVEVLLTLGVLVLGHDGRYRCDRIVVSCWPHRNRQTDPV